MIQTLQLSCKSEKELPNISKQLLSFAQEIKVWAFQGQLGAGKTTLIKQLAKLLHVSDSMSSPSFSIVNEYSTTDNKTIYHLDLYRLKNIEEAMEIGIEEYLYSNNYCFIEWPEVIEELLPEALIALEIKIHDLVDRTIKASKYE